VRQAGKPGAMADQPPGIFSRLPWPPLGRSGIGFQPVAPWANPAPWLFCITLDEEQYGRTRDELMALLSEEGIETRPFFIALHRLPPFREESRRREEVLPVTDRLSATGMNLPTYVGLSNTEIDNITDVIKRLRK